MPAVNVGDSAPHLSPIRHCKPSRCWKPEPLTVICTPLPAPLNIDFGSTESNVSGSPKSNKSDEREKSTPLVETRILTGDDVGRGVGKLQLASEEDIMIPVVICTGKAVKNDK